MKRVIIILISVFAVLLISLIAVPFIFKDKIMERIDREISGAVDAQIYYDFNNISLSVFKRFPNVSATIREFGIKGNPPFQNDTLIHMDNFQVDLNLKSILFDDVPELTGIHLNGGSLYVKVLEDGRANYDIALPSESENPGKEVSEFQLGVNLIEVRDFDIIYDDRQLDYFMALSGINLDGLGDFTSSEYDLAAKMDAMLVKMDYEGTNYLNNKKVVADTRIHINMDEMLFDLDEATFALNDFIFGLDGFLALPEDAMVVDLSFKGKENTFKSILSLVPGIYTGSFENIRTSGTMDFEGFVKGQYSDTDFPSFGLALKVADGMFQYPDLPRPVENIQMDISIKNESNDLDYTQINISRFDMKFGSNPINGRFLIDNLVTYDMDGSLVGKLDLEELTSIFPIDGMELRGVLDVDAKAKGRYDSINKRIPALNVSLLLDNAYVKSADYPAPIENLHVKGSMVNNSGNMNDLFIDLSSFGFELEGESIQGNMKINDLDQLNWDGYMKGTMDLGKLVTIFPLENVIMEGKINADINSKGSYADVEASQYDRLQTSGNLGVKDFYYTDLDVPQGIRIRDAAADFSPRAINLTKFDARLGESPVQATGNLTNYMSYIFGENEVLSGRLNVSSSKFNINEWMTESTTEESTAPLTVIELPRNVDFTMEVTANEVLYDNLVFRDAKGQMTLKDGIMTFRNASMQTLGGTLGLNGSYNSQNITTPKFDMIFDVTSLSIQEAFKTFNTVKAFAPVAQHITGNFTTKFSLSGDLGQDMMPVLSSLDGKGLVQVAEAAFKDSQIISGITSLTNLNDTNTLNFRNLNISTEIENGMLNIRPFDVKLWDYQANVQGSTGFDGSINYLINLQVPAEKFGSQVNSLVSGLTGADFSKTMVPLAINLGGTYSNPRIGLAGGESLQNSLTNALRSQVSSTTAKVQENITAEFKAKEDSIKQELKSKAEVAKDSVRQEAEKTVNQTKDKAVDEIKGLLKGFGSRQKANPDSKPN